MLTTLDWAVIIIYLAAVVFFGIWASGRQSTINDYFLGSKDMPWYAVSFSIVATETSTLTVVGTPAIAYLGTLTFLQLTFGYLLGRIVVSLIFLPKYFQGNLTTAYGFLGKRFGDGMRATASVTFLGTRLLADGVRLFATAIPLKVVADSVGFEIDYWQIILLIGLATIAYTYVGGIKAVVWMDVVQMSIYVGGGIWAVFILLGAMPGDWWATATEAGKTVVLFSGFNLPFSEWFTQPYTFLTGLVAGGVFSMASHGTDQLIVQRVLTCRNLIDGQKALVTSGVLVIFQFGLFLIVGLLLWIYYNQATLPELGVGRGDEIFPRFIIEGMPAGVSGLILAGILAAAMSTLSSSLNSLASSSMMDLYQRYSGRTPDENKELKLSRLFTLIWGLVFIVFANLFQDQENPVIELGLAIASFTYGGLLGAFLLGLLNRVADQKDCIIAFFTALLFMIWVIFGIWYSAEGEWIFTFYPSDEEIARLGLRGIAWPWYTVIGTIVTIVVGTILSARHNLASKRSYTR